jgi:hypothetical protein
MWGSTTSWRDESDGEFVVWHVRAESDDGRIQTVSVKIDAGAVRFEEGPVGGRAPGEVREAIETRGKSVIEHRGHRMDLPPSFLYRRGFGGFIQE